MSWELCLTQLPTEPSTTGRGQDGRNGLHVPFVAESERPAVLFWAVCSRTSALDAVHRSGDPGRRLTGRTTALGVLTALMFLPMLFVGAYAGAVCRSARSTQDGDAHAGRYGAASGGIGNLRSDRNYQHRHHLCPHVRVGHRDGVRQPSSPWICHRTGARGGHRQRDLPQHGGDDRLSHLRSGDSRVAGRPVGNRLAVLDQCVLVRGDPRQPVPARQVGAVPGAAGQ